MTELKKCHMCGIGTDAESTCCDCGRHVCEDCCVMPTYMNQIDYTICTECGDARESDAMEEREREWKYEDELCAKREKRAAARRANYWKPENIAKRKEKRVALLLARKEANEKRIEEAARIVGEMFRGVL